MKPVFTEPHIYVQFNLYIIKYVKLHMYICNNVHHYSCVVMSQSNTTMFEYTLFIYDRFTCIGIMFDIRRDYNMTDQQKYEQ